MESDLTLGQHSTKRMQRDIQETKKRAWDKFHKELQDHFNKNPKMEKN
jgi:uncharacterized membrane-anchored protein YhcB (DUF1043 family)